MEENLKEDWVRFGKEFNTMVYDLINNNYRFCEGLTWDDNKAILWFSTVFRHQLKKTLLDFYLITLKEIYEKKRLEAQKKKLQEEQEEQKKKLQEEQKKQIELFFEKKRTVRKKYTRRQYTTEERREILLSILKIGCLATSKKFGIPYYTVKYLEDKLKKNKVL